MALDALFEDAKRRVQASPGDIKARSALWQIFAARGEFDRARTQLDALLAIDSSWTMEVAACHLLLQAEAQRQEVFSGRQMPTCLGEPPAWFASLAAGLQTLGEGSQAAQWPAAAALLARAQQDSPARQGQLNGQPFEWLCDGDARLGPCLEVMVQGKYLWLPWSLVRRIESRPPTEIRDRLWLHALLELGDEGSVEVFLPARYPFPQDDAQMLGERTDWQALDGDSYLGRGQKTLMTDSSECGLLDVRELLFTS
ncbi:type VI secretion system accessory protein TagJ [Inhella sp.]|uniref:type VI secretion system accessory protein TagJ n=1 Tax=Inhella sp. TaxID=1921806 RepID=UPI0035B00BE9